MGRGEAQHTKDLINAMHEVLEVGDDAIAPASVRAVYYQMIGRKGTDGSPLITPTKRGYKKVSRALTIGRDDGRISWDSIIDQQRRRRYAPTWKDPKDYAESIATYRRDFWQFQPYTVEVWSEKSTVEGLLWPTLKRYGVDFLALKGWSSTTSVHEAAEFTAHLRYHLRVLYIGDWDPSGMYMSEKDLPRRLKKYRGKVSLTRIALRREDLRVLPQAFETEEKEQDTRREWYEETYGLDCWEVDAINPNRLRERVSNAIERLIVNKAAWARAATIEQAEQESIRTILERINGL